MKKAALFPLSPSKMFYNVMYKLMQKWFNANPAPEGVLRILRRKLGRVIRKAHKEPGGTRTGAGHCRSSRRHVIEATLFC
jgi:hypothetical protein